MNINLVIDASILFFVLEFVLILTKRSKKKDAKTRDDKRSLLLFWITIPLGISFGFFASKHGQWLLFNQYIAVVGLCIFTIGLGIRWISILRLQKEFTVDVAITENHQLKTNGMYRYIRHPSYLGLLLVLFGLSIATNSWLSVAFMTIPVLFAVIYRIKIEEKILTQEFGIAYQEYCQKTERLIPKVY